MTLRTISPVDGSVYAERTAATAAQIDQTLQRARAAQPQWREVPVAERAAIIGRFCGEFERRGTQLATELSWQMGRPIRFAASEVRGTLERARYMAGVAASALADVDPGPKSGFRRFIRREPLDFVAFTGSVAGGRAVQRVAAERFIGVGLELGGCDPVYVRHDADLPHAIENIVDGAYFNSGQSCCGLQRIFVHESVYDRFTRGCIELIQQYRLGDPLDPQTTLGPVVRTAAAAAIRAQVRAAIEAGARPMIEERDFPRSTAGTPYLAPQLLLDAPGSSSVMREEIFGPVAGIMKVRSDAEAVAQMNDSSFGLTAAVWTRDAAAAVTLGGQVQTGTWFMNRCDYLDPALAWVGVKDSGRGCTLSVVGYEHLTRPKSFHLRVST